MSLSTGQRSNALMTQVWNQAILFLTSVITSVTRAFTGITNVYFQGMNPVGKTVQQGAVRDLSDPELFGVGLEVGPASLLVYTTDIQGTVLVRVLPASVFGTASNGRERLRMETTVRIG